MRTRFPLSLTLSVLTVGLACSDDPADPNDDPVPVASVTVVPDTATIDEGAQVQLDAVVMDADQNELTGRTVTWSSGDETVAEVGSSGLVSGIAPGRHRSPPRATVWMDWRRSPCWPQFPWNPC